MPAPPAEPSSDESTSTTILVVEPDILVRMVIADYLRDCGYKVVEGVNADESLPYWTPEERSTSFWPRFS